jgi:hypothetical protein
VVEHLPSKHEALNSNPNTTKKKDKEKKQGQNMLFDVMISITQSREAENFKGIIYIL